MKDYELQLVLDRLARRILARGNELTAAAALIPWDDPRCVPANRMCADKLRGMIEALDVIRKTESELLEELKCKSEATDAAQSAGGN